MIDWREVTVEDLAAPERFSVVGGPFGSALGRKDYVDHGVPVIRGAQLAGPGEFSHDDILFVTQEKADQHNGNLAYPGDVLVTQRGTVGQVGRIPEDAPHPRYLLSQSQMKLTVDPSTVDARFVYYALLGPHAQHALHGSTVSAGVPHINLATFRQLRLLVPQLATQRRVSAVLGAIDDLIENNRRRIGVLEQMAQAIYREWFVRFRYPGHETATFVDSPHGAIPEGWKVSPASVALTINPRIPIDKTVARPFLTMGDLKERSHVCFPSGRKAGSSGAKFQNGDTLFARITPCLENGKTGYVQCLANGETGRGSTEFIVLRGRLVGPAFTYLLARDEDFRANAIKSMSGASGRQRVRNECFDSYLMTIPPPNLGQQFESHARPLLLITHSLALQGRELARMRDVLLPKLVTGQIDVSQLDLDGVLEPVG